MKVWYSTLFSPHRTPSMCTQQAQPSIFFICGKMAILGKKFSKAPMCLVGAYTYLILSEVKTRYLKCVLMRFWAKKNFENFTAKS